MKNELINLVLLATVGIIIMGVVLVPVINDITDGDKDTFTNGTNYMTYYEGDATLTFTSSGVTMGTEELADVSGIYLYGETIYTYGITNGIAIAYQGQSASIQIADDSEYTMTVTDGTATLNDGTDDVATFDCPGFYIVSEDPTNTVVASPTTAKYFNNIEDVTFSYARYGMFYHFEDGKLYVNGVETDYTIDSGYSETEGYKDLYNSTGNFVLTVGGNSVTASMNYLWSANVTGTVEGSEPSSAEISLYYVIPTILIMAIVLAAVRIFRRD